MKRPRFIKIQTVSELKQQEDSILTKELWPKLSISEATFYNWKNKYGGMEAQR